MSIARVLRLDDWRVKLAAQHEAIRGKKPIARGVFSAVYDGSKPNTVYKLTADSFGYWMVNCNHYGVKHRHFPKVHKDFGDIGVIKLNGKEFPLYLFGMERLEKVTGEAKKQAQAIVRRQAHTLTNAWKWPQLDRALFCVQDMLRDKTFPRSILSAFIQLEEFCCNYPGAAMDMHIGNFMKRKNGELVITDPLMDKAVMAAKQATLRHSYY